MVGTNVKLAAVPQNVVALTPDNFYKIVLDQKRCLGRVLCPMTYEKVATVFKQEEGVVIANLDADAHKILGDKYGTLYSKLAKKYIEKGSGYASKEVKRLGHVLGKSGSPVKADEFTLKRNILNTLLLLLRSQKP
ncbi:unnamed protein product [Eruca vesicaria subsp. sativa]|uniref:Endoplasmic reticulum resident protein 29 C-terminal domain-containing protein n=1 Tax=Eruca vesicaria subsp. sativa TaxID=29727 RepID=A0ABC8KUN2_ERUVS|nr:unnamed protein product [Eruca vesicaria subsp. sativa]